MIPNNACALRLTAAAGTELAGASSGGTVRRVPYLDTRVSSRLTVVYTPKGFLPHAASLRQSFDHCAIFPTAASRRSLGRISVPMWRVVLSDPLRVIALVSRYLTNKLIRRDPLAWRERASRGPLWSASHAGRGRYAVLARVSPGCPPPDGRLVTCYSPVRHSAPGASTWSSFDLHVLGTPPAFVLSQDQTLRKRKKARTAPNRTPIS